MATMKTYYEYDQAGRMTTQWTPSPSSTATYFTYNQRNMVTGISRLPSAAGYETRSFGFSGTGERTVIQEAPGIENVRLCTYDGIKPLVEVELEDADLVTRYRHSETPQDAQFGSVLEIEVASGDRGNPVFDGAGTQNRIKRSEFTDSAEFNAFGEVLGQVNGLGSRLQWESRVGARSLGWPELIVAFAFGEAYLPRSVLVLGNAFWEDLVPGLAFFDAPIDVSDIAEKAVRVGKWLPRWIAKGVGKIILKEWLLPRARRELETVLEHGHTAHETTQPPIAAPLAGDGIGAVFGAWAQSRCGPDVTELLLAHLTAFRSAPRIGLVPYVAPSIDKILAPAARENSGKIQLAALACAGCSTPKRTCEGTVTFAGKCISMRHIDHILIIAYAVGAYGSTVAKAAADAHELTGFAGGQPTDWEAADIAFNDRVLCLTNGFYASGTISPGAATSCMSTADMRVIGRKPRVVQGADKPGGTYLNCRPCATKLPALTSLRLPPNTVLREY